jgi:two-component system cell cycle response regulator
MPLSAVMLDIDFFKQVNDTYGHSVGDAVIRAVAEILAEHTRTCDILCRYGGEEFCVLLPETDEASAIIWAQRFRQRVAEAAVAAGDTSIKVTVSLGVAEMFAEMDAQGDLLALADQCLLAAKDQGRNRVVSFRALAASGTLGIDEDLAPGSGLEGVLARDVMIPLFYCVRADWTVARAAAYLLQFRVSSVPVTNEEGCLLGIVSEKDVLRVAHKTEAPLRYVEEILRSNIISFADTTPLPQILSFLTRASIRSVIITHEGKPCGLISRAAVVRWFLENRWNPEPPDLGRCSGSTGPEVSLSNDPEMLGSMTDGLVQLADQMRRQLRGAPPERDQAAIVGGVSRMQQLLDELLCASSLRPIGAGLPS